ncbi:head-tail adaptor protein [Pedobacter sp. HDW13]|uniref:phage head completion protein n=1 Tax=Pedobacter sp. HDW13 TaxID=2714940 RepID=UPI001409F9F5|nr:head-tail adaptor protein [Pedobacter sp. HDW13]QIL41022.1 head-tail adaptor protein [Pedobacter sp. HDW13]
MKRDRIKVYSLESVQDAGGGFNPDQRVLYWETAATVKAAKVKRDLQSYQTDLEIPMEFKVMFRRDKNVTKNMIISYEDQDYTIHSIVNVDQDSKDLLLTGITRA